MYKGSPVETYSRESRFKRKGVIIEQGKSTPNNHDDAFSKLLGFAVRARKVVFGRTAVERGVHRSRVRLIVIDGKSARSTVDFIERLSRSSGCPVVVFRGDRSLDRLVGKANCRCLGITDPQFARSLEQRSGIDPDHHVS